MLSRRKRLSARPDFGDDLLCRIYPEPWHFSEPLNGGLMRTKQLRHLVIELCALSLDQSQFLERQVDEPPINGVKSPTRAESIAQLFRRGAQSTIGQSR